MRLSILFIAPPEKDFDWDPQAVAGCNRFLKRAWRVIWELTYAAADGGVDTSEDAKKLERELHRLGMKVTDDYARMQYNIAIAGLMEIVNAASLYLHDTEGKVRDAKLADEVARDLVSMLSPITPHMCEELWHEALGEKGSAYDCTWPQFDASKSVSDTVEIAVQVSGKVRGHAVVPVDAATEEVEAAAKEAVASYLADKNVIKVIVIPNKLVNIVAK
jgi:leucyl-tRNA synthetase